MVSQQYGRHARQLGPDRGRVLPQPLTAFDVDQDGDLSHRRVWAELGTDVPDGICMDVEGAIWYADVEPSACGRRRKCSRRSLNRGCFCCALGGSDAEPCSSLPPTGRGLSTCSQANPLAGCSPVTLALPHTPGHPQSQLPVYRTPPRRVVAAVHHLPDRLPALFTILMRGTSAGHAAGGGVCLAESSRKTGAVKSPASTRRTPDGRKRSRQCQRRVASRARLTTST